MCKCGCNTCGTNNGPLLTESKVKSLLSEGLQYHIDKKVPLFETVYRIGSDKHLSLIREARKMYSRNVINLCEEDEALIKTHLGEFGLYEGESVPLDLPMLNEAYYEVVANLGDKKTKENLDSFEEVQDFMDKMVKRNAISVDVTKFGKDKKQTIKYSWAGDKWEKTSKPYINESMDYEIGHSLLFRYDEASQSEFGMDYDQLGSGEKEWVRDEIDNMSMNEDKIDREKIEGILWNLKNSNKLSNPSDPKKKEALIKKLEKQLSRLNESDSNYPDFDLNKNIRYQDTSISSGMWRYTGKEQGGKGVYRNLNNGQILGFDRSDFDIFRNNLSSHFDFLESLNEKEGVPHYTKDGKEWKGKLHKMPDGSLMSGNPHDKNGSGPNGKSEKLYHKEDLKEDRKYNQEELLRLDLIARRKFDCDYKNCTDEQKAEVLKDKIKVGVKEALQEAKQDIYDKFLDNPSSPKGRAKSLILKFTKEYGDDASSMAVDRFASKNNLKPEEKYILKYITKNDIKISSQSGGPDFSAVSEAEFKGKEVALNKPKRGGPKAYYVYVKDGDKIKKVTFGSGGLRAKIKNKEARNAFAARHNCKDKKDRTKAGYWSCNTPRYAQALGLGANQNTFW